MNANTHFTGVMNNTKWEELRLAMLSLGSLSPQFQIKDVMSDQPSAWDGEWYYHFRLLPYSTIEWCDLRVRHEEQRREIRQILYAIHLPGEATEEGFRIYGWIQNGAVVNYLK